MVCRGLAYGLEKVSDHVLGARRTCIELIMETGAALPETHPSARTPFILPLLSCSMSKQICK